MDSPKASRSNRPAMDNSSPVQDSPFSLFASSLSPIPLKALNSSSFVTFPSPEPVFASPQVHQARNLNLLRRSEHQLFPCSSKEHRPHSSDKAEITKMPLEMREAQQEQPCSSSSVSIETFLIDQSEPSIQTSHSNPNDSQETETNKLKTESNQEGKTQFQAHEINSNSNSKIIIHNNDISPINTPKPSGIGLHLNSLAGGITPLTSGPHDSEPVSLVHGGPGLSSNFEENISSPLLAKILDPFLTPLDGKKPLLLEDSVKHEETVKNSPKRKRKKSGDDGHKSCNCKRSKCLKLYCECFGNGMYCNETCACQNCSNEQSQEELVKEVRKNIESRNPLAFAPKVVLRVTQTEENNEATPPSTRHKRGCNCKKSRCLKKYCECFQSGVACFLGCRCENCLNKFGVKDAAGEITEVEHKKPLEISETGTGTSTDPSEGARSKTMIRTELNNLPRLPPLTPSMSHISSTYAAATSSPPDSSSLPLDPLQFPRSSPVSPSSPVHKFSFPHDQDPLQFLSSPHLKKHNADYSPDILEEFHMRMGVVKSTSPKKKRVDPPHARPQNSPGLRSGRKFILQSVPSLPSLSPYRNGDDGGNSGSNNNT